jgi:hypothetical protein
MAKKIIVQLSMGKPVSKKKKHNHHPRHKIPETNI